MVGDRGRDGCVMCERQGSAGVYMGEQEGGDRYVSKRQGDENEVRQH